MVSLLVAEGADVNVLNNEEKMPKEMGITVQTRKPDGMYVFGVSGQ
jgi:hypothetical protein